MPRSTNAPASRKRRKRRLKMARGFMGSRHRLYRTATEAVDKAMSYAFIHRKQKKRQYRALWIARINAACKMNDITYSRFIDGMKKAGIGLNRKVLADLAVHDPDGFTEIVGQAKSALA